MADRLRAGRRYAGRLLCVAALSVAAVQAHATLLTNGDFETGDFTGWTLFTTPNGDLMSGGVPGAPQVTPFDTNGDSVATNSAQFSVGRAPGVGTGDEGGGIFQSFSVAAGGLVDFSVDIAANDSSANVDAGDFTLLVNGAVVDTEFFGGIDAETLRSTLTGTVALAAGVHEFRILITRPFQANTIELAQYVDNAVATPQSAPVPETATVVLLATGLLGAALGRRRKG